MRISSWRGKQKFGGAEQILPAYLIAEAELQQSRVRPQTVPELRGACVSMRGLCEPNAAQTDPRSVAAVTIVANAVSVQYQLLERRIDSQARADGGGSVTPQRIV